MNIEEYARKHPKTKNAPISDVVLEQIERLPDNSKILDIGCTEGSTIRFLHNIFKDRFYYFGIDLSETRIKVAQNLNLSKTKFIVSNAQDIPLEDDHIDCILSSQLIEHVEDESSLLFEVKRLLKPSGFFQIDTVYKEKLAWYFYRSPSGWALDPTHLREYSDIEYLKDLFEESGLSTQQLYKEQCFRVLGKRTALPIKIPIPGYYTLFIIGTNKI